MTTVLETCQIPPPPGAAAELSIPLSFFDIPWVNHHPVRRLLFYNYPCSKAKFLETLVPQLKQSLSLTLKHYLPVAGNLLYPLDSDERKPVFRYVSGDSVQLTIAESSNDLDELTANHARDADQFYDFVPLMPPATEESEYKTVPLLALQVTLFPNRGICVGFAYHHTICDGNSIASLMLAWASINKFGGDEEFITRKGESLPVFDRSVIQDTHGTDTLFWKVFGKIPFKPPSSSFPIPTNRVRATFILTQPHINKLKDLVLANKPGLVHVSSFVVTVSYVWTCFVKSGDVTGEGVGDNESELILLPADARGRLNSRINPPIPTNYFGNCLGGAMPIIEHKKLVGEKGFLIAAEDIAEQIKNRVNNKDEFLKDVEDWPSQMQKLGGLLMRAFGVGGSPKFDFYIADFGWGKATKLEMVSMDEETYSMSLCKSRDFDGGLEVGFSLPKQRMEAFAAIFADGLRS